MDFHNRVVKWIGWNFFLLILAAPVGYAVRILYANTLPKLHVGLFYAVLDFCSMVAIFKDLGLRSALVRFIPGFLSQGRRDLVKSAILSAGALQVAVALVIAMLIVLFAPFIAQNYINRQGEFSAHLDLAVKTLVILSVGYWFQSIFDVVASAIQGFQSQKYFATIKISRISLVFILSVFFIYVLGLKNALSPTYAYTITPLILLVIYGYVFLKKIFQDFFRTKFRFSVSLLRKMFSYGLHIMLGSAGGLVLGYLDGICLTFFTGLDAVADYRTVAMPTVSILGYFSSAVGVVFFPLSAELWEKGRHRELASSFEKANLYTFALVWPGAVLMAYFPTVVVNLLFNPRYLPAAEAIRVLSLGAVFMALVRIGFSVFNGMGMPGLSTKILYAGSGFNLATNVLLIPRLGIVGAAFATSASYFLMWLIQAWYFRRFLKLRYSRLLKRWSFLILAGLVSLIPTVKVIDLFSSPLWQLVVGIVIYGFLYVILLKFLHMFFRFCFYIFCFSMFLV